MSRPSDRGYVMINNMPDGTTVVEVYARRQGRGRPSHLYASHVGCSQVVVESHTRFERAGNATYSTEPVEVLWDEARNAVIVRDPVQMETVT